MTKRSGLGYRGMTGSNARKLVLADLESYGLVADVKPHQRMVHGAAHDAIVDRC